jgi:hypothetical protein
MSATCDGTCGSRDNIKLLLDYLQGWTFGRIVDKAPGETITRDQMHDRMAHLAFTNERFRQELLANPRLVYMIALEEAMGIDKLDYVCQVKEVRVLEESEDILYLVIPTCHYGCQAEGVSEPPAESQGTCHVCGMTLPAGQTGCTASDRSAAQEGGLSRKEIESRMTDRAAREKSFKDALLFQPLSTYRQFARELSGEALPAYLEGVRDIRVLPETDRSIFYIMPLTDPLARAVPEMSDRSTLSAPAAAAAL